jgi:hypothetical protein
MNYLVNDRTKYAFDFYSERQMPKFISDERDTFLDFLNVYYKFVEWFSLDKYFDVDMDFSNFDPDSEHIELKNFILDRFVRVFSPDIPSKSYGDIDFVTFIKYISQFYRSKGTEASVRFLYYLLFGSSSKIYVPWDDVIKTNTAYYGENTSINHFVEDLDFNMDEVTHIEQRDENGKLVFKCYVFSTSLQYFYGGQYHTSLVGGILGEYDRHRKITYFIGDVSVGLGVLSPGIVAIGSDSVLVSMNATRIRTSGVINAHVELDINNSKRYGFQIISCGVMADNPTVTMETPLDGDIELPVTVGYFFKYYTNPVQTAYVLQDGFYYEANSYAVVSDFYTNMKCVVSDYYQIVKQMTKPVESKMFQTVNLYNYEMKTSDKNDCNSYMTFNGDFAFSGDMKFGGIIDTYCKEPDIPAECLKYTTFLDAHNV